MLDKTTFTAAARGVSYYLRLDGLGRWEVSSQRDALRAARMGGTVRHFKTLAEVSSSIRAFHGLDVLVAA